jgi:hypothetical protein
MAKRDKKSKNADQKARAAAKLAKHSAQKEKKLKAKQNEDSDMEDVDIESVLEQYAKEVCGSEDQPFMLPDFTVFIP